MAAVVLVVVAGKMRESLLKLQPRVNRRLRVRNAVSIGYRESQSLWRGFVFRCCWERGELEKDKMSMREEEGVGGGFSLFLLIAFATDLIG